MKQTVERRKPLGFLDYFSLAVTTCGVGYLPLAPGTWGSLVGVAIYVFIAEIISWLGFISPLDLPSDLASPIHAIISVLLLTFCLVGIWASGRSTDLLGNTDPSQAVVDEVMGQLVVFLFVPFFISWPFVLAGFLLFRFFDIWKPYPIDSLQVLPGGIGICADDILAGVYAGVCLAVVYAVSLSI